MAKFKRILSLVLALLMVGLPLPARVFAEPAAAPALTLSLDASPVAAPGETVSVKLVSTNTDLIYYTTDGSDPGDQNNAGRMELSEVNMQSSITVSSPQGGGVVTLKALASGGGQNSELQELSIGFYPYEQSETQTSVIMLSEGGRDYYFDDASYAFEAADMLGFEDEITLRLLRSFDYTAWIKINNKVKLDLNGQTLNLNRSGVGPGEYNKSSIGVLTGGLTVTDSSAPSYESAGVIDFGPNSGIVVSPTGEMIPPSSMEFESVYLKLENGTLRTLDNLSKNMAHQVVSFYNRNCRFEMSGGKLIGLGSFWRGDEALISGGVWETVLSTRIFFVTHFKDIHITGGEFRCSDSALAAAIYEPLIQINGFEGDRVRISGGRFSSVQHTPVIFAKQAFKAGIIFDGPAEIVNTGGPALYVSGSNKNEKGSVTITENSGLKLKGAKGALVPITRQYSDYTGEFYGSLPVMPRIEVSGGYFACGDGCLPIEDSSYITFPDGKVLDTQSSSESGYEGFYTLVDKDSLSGTYLSGESYTYQDFDGQGLGDTGLDGIIADADSVYGDGSNSDGYSEDMWQAFELSYKAAKRVRGNLNANQKEIDFRAAALSSSMQALMSSSDVDVTNLPDGVYRVPLTMYKYNYSGLSMAGGAIGEDATLVMSGGKGKLSIHFKPANVMSVWGHVLQWWLLKGDTPDAALSSGTDPENDANRIEAVYSDSYFHAQEATDANVTPNPDAAAGLSSEYPYVGTATIDMPYFGSSGGWQYIYCHAGVDAMRDIASQYPGKSGDASMAIAINWGRLRAEAVEPAITLSQGSVSLLKNTSCEISVGTDFAQSYTLNGDVQSGASSVATGAINGGKLVVTAVGEGETELSVSAYNSEGAVISAKLHVVVVPENAPLIDVADASVDGDTVSARIKGDIILSSGGPAAVDVGRNEIKIDASAAGAADKALITIEKKTAEALSLTLKKIVIRTNAGSVGFDAAAMKDIASSAGDIVFSLEKRSDKPVISNRYASSNVKASYDLSLRSGGSDIDFSNGKATVSVARAEGISNNEMNGYAYHVKDGKLIEIQRLTTVNDISSWTVKHFSTWVLINGLYALDGASGPETPAGPAQGIDVTKPGSYLVPVSLGNANSYELSMGDPAFDNNRKALIINSGSGYRMQLCTNPIKIDDITGGIGTVSCSSWSDTSFVKDYLPGSEKKYVAKIDTALDELIGSYIITVTVPGTPMIGEFDARLVLHLDRAEETSLSELTHDPTPATGKMPDGYTGEVLGKALNSGDEISSEKLSEYIEAGGVNVANKDIGIVASFDEAALKAIEKAAGGASVSVKLEEASDMNEAQRKAAGGASAYSFTVLANGKPVDSFGRGRVTLRVPCSLKNGQDESGLVVYRIYESGAVKALSCKYDAAEASVSFKTGRFSVYTVGYDENRVWTRPFGDVAEDAWYCEAVKYAFQNGLFAGTGKSSFSPDAEMNRAMLVTVLYRMEGKPSQGGAAPFKDIKQGAYYGDAVSWAAENGIVSGLGNGLFGPDRTLTREQLAAILYKYALYKGYDTEYSAELSKYGDSGNISAYAEPAMKWAAGAQLISGVSDSSIAPDASAVRAQVAAILMRFAEKIAD